MRIIESEIHDILLDIAPDHDYDDQARIVAVATALFSDNSERFNKKIAGKNAAQNPEKVKEAQIVDSIFQAMKRIAEWSEVAEEDTDYTETFVDGRGLDPTQIVNRAAATVMRKYTGHNFGDMDVLNDSDLDEFFGEGGGKMFFDDPDEDSIYLTPGMGRHRSDFQVNNGHR